MNTSDNKAVYFKREALKRVVEAFDKGTLEKNAYRIPFEVIPPDSKSAVRCCIYKERAVFRARTLAAMGCSVEKDDEATSLNDYAKQALLRKAVPEVPLTVMDIACKGCVKARHIVTEACQGCLARPCQQACKFGAISFSDGRSHIDPEKCKNCGMCVQVCPYQAIQKIIVPCESACPVGAIAKDENGHAKIDFDKCISCGKCASACPFGAVHEKSQIIDVLKNIKAGKKTIAMVAPAMFGQLPCKPQQLKEAILKLGFADVYEGAQGADVTTKTEAAEFEERLMKGAEFMTTSCCAGYNELVDKHIPEMKPFRSDTKTPMYYTAEIVKRENPDAVTVFFSPCVAKKREALQNPNVDYVLNYEEIGAWMIALGVQVAECDESEFKTQASAEGRNYCVTGGVAKAVQTLLPEEIPAHPVIIDGLTKQTVRDLKKYAKNGMCELGNLIEVMACTGGCLGGNSTVNAFKPALKQVTNYVNESKSIKEQID